jgi:hypothetical protein
MFYPLNYGNAEGSKSGEGGASKPASMGCA